ERGYGRETLYWTVVVHGTQGVRAHDRINPCDAGIIGFIGVLAKEYPNWRFRLVDAEDGHALCHREIFGMPFDRDGNVVAVRDGRLFAQRLLPIEHVDRNSDDESSMFKRDGVYVILGGAGGIGEALTEWLIKRFDANTIWIGRSEEDSVIR